MSEQMNMNTSIDDFLKTTGFEETLPESLWVKWDKVGKEVIGAFLECEYREASGQFKAQNIYTIDLGEKVSLIPFKINKGSQKYIDLLSKAIKGQLVKFKYESDFPTPLKPAKIISATLLTKDGKPLMHPKYKDGVEILSEEDKNNPLMKPF